MDLLLSTALKAADAAAQVHLKYFREVGIDGAVEKAQSDFVTEVDLKAQEEAIGVIVEAFPDHAILAEEEGAANDQEATRGAGKERVAGDPETPLATRLVSNRQWPSHGKHLWIVDPLDGTTNFLHGHPMFAASVGVGRARIAEGEADGNPGLHLSGVLEAGAVVAPVTGERWWARRNGGAWKNGKAIGISRVRELEKALIGTGFPFKEPEIVPRYAEQLKRVLPGTGGVRRGGSAALDLCYLAEGILDGFWEEDYLSPWDSAAGLVILSEAGGMASRLDGATITLENGSILAGNSPGILEGLSNLLRETE
jgi:myo-inositol-1(or 4)-monophosphatase